eukprot:15326068-Ditylum_brightwellii.AAC.2
MDEKSSNLCKFCDTVDGMEEEGKVRRLKGVEVFLIGDNFVAEATYYQGSSSGKFLHYKMVRLRKVESTYQCTMHLIHCTGM